MAICLIAVYVVAINGDPPRSIVVSRTFRQQNIVRGKEGNPSEIQCTPNYLCDRVNITEVTCTGKALVRLVALSNFVLFPANVTLPPPADLESIDYTCESEQYTNTNEKVEWKYTINCTKQAVEPGQQPACWVQITLTQTVPTGVKVFGLITIVIVVLVIAVPIAILSCFL